MVPKELRLKVAEAIQDDVNKGIVRIDSNLLAEIGIKPGGIVELEGERKTVAIADRSYPGDIELGIIRMDGIVRKNAKTGIGETVSIRQAQVKEAKRVVIAPSKKGVMIKASPAIFKSGLLGRAMVKGDIVALGGTRRRRNTMMENPFFEDVFSILDESMMGIGFADIKFVVVDVQPKQAVIVTENTEVEYKAEAVEVAEDGAPDITYEDIGGLEDEIKKIREMVELPLKHPEIFERLGIEAPKGVLLHGPPGTGKTLIAKAVAAETNSHFIVINGPEIMSKYYGQSEENIRKKFEEAEKNAPSIIFIDEIDAIASKREETRGEVERRVVAQLLALMDGLNARGKVVVIAATNVPNILDPALRRPGRFDREIEIGVPKEGGREIILKIHTRNMPLDTPFYEEVASKVLIQKIDKSLKNYNSQIKSNTKDISLKLLEIERAKEEITKFQQDLKELQQLKEKGDENFVRKILNKMSNLQLTINEKKKELVNTTDDITKFKEEIGIFKENIKKLNADNAFLSVKKQNLVDIVKEIQSIEHSKEIWGGKDPRTAFLNSSHEKENFKEILADLIDLKIVDVPFYEEVGQGGKEKDLKEIAKKTHGFVGADLSSLAKESAMIVIRRVIDDIKLFDKAKEDKQIPKELLEKLVILKEDFEAALRVVRPSALREVLIEKPSLKWSDIGGLSKIKQELVEAVEWPLSNPKVFETLGIKPPRGILLYGAPGTGKTLIAKAVANECEANFISVKGPELLSKWVGESEKAVREIFKKARQAAPSIIFFDEIDSLAPRRGVGGDNNVSERVVNQLLTEIDGLEEMKGVVIIAATNRPDILDPALLRPGRFDRIILTPVPDAKGRLEIFKIHGNHLTDEATLAILADKAEGYVGADIEAVCREAAIFALRENINTKRKEVKKHHFEEALNKVRPSVNKEVEKEYIEIQDHFSSAKAKQMLDERPNYMG